MIQDGESTGVAARAFASDEGPPTSFPVEAGNRMYELVSELYPICRSITGEGVRRSLRILAERLPLVIHEVPTGTRVFDWRVPKEWNIRDAYILDPQGTKVVDFQDHSLHVVGYSVPVRKKLSLGELIDHIHTLPDSPDLIPYRTSYYRKTWGFCMEHRRLRSLPDDVYEVVVDTSLEDGSLTYGEAVVRGDTSEEILISTHVCHPSLANDNLSGVAVAAELLAHLGECARRAPRRYSYRFLFIPGTIGAITWLARNQEVAQRVRHGLVLAGVGDPGSLTYKRSRREDAEIDRAVAAAFRDDGREARIEPFSPYGYDERQYCSPGFDLPMGCLMRTPWGRYPEYHTSADNLSFVQPEALADSFTLCKSVFEILEHNRAFLNTQPRCEPQLGNRGLYDVGGSDEEKKRRNWALLWVLNQSDGKADLLAIADRAGLPFAVVQEAAEALQRTGLLEPL